MPFPVLIVEIASLVKGQQKNISGVLDLDYIDVPLGKIPFSRGISYDICLEVVDGDFLLSGSVETELEYPCVRCLESVSIPVRGSVEAHYVDKSKYHGNNEGEFDSLENVIYYEGSEIDLYDRITEAVALEIPEYVVCSPECKGLCPFCGENLNENPNHVCEGSKELETPSPFDKLRNLSDIFNDEE